MLLDCLAGLTPRDYTLPPGVYAKALTLAHARYLEYFGTASTSAILFYLVLRLRIGPRLRDFAERHFRRLALQTVLFVPPLLALLGLATLPWLLYAHHTFLQLGISVERWAPWSWDWAKDQLVSIVIGTPIAWLFCVIVRRGPRRYWLWFWLASLPLMVAGVYLAPLVLDPMFNRFEPLAITHPELVAPIEEILRNAHVAIPEDHLFEMIASEKTNALNAYTTGFGSSKRVVLYDTIIGKEPLPELMTTFGHELGHYALHHILWGLLLGAAFLLAGMYVGNRFVEAVLRRYGQRFGIRDAGDLAALPLFLLFAVGASFLTDPLTNAVSRVIEHQADAYALQVTGGVVPHPGYAAARAFQTEGETDLALPDPNPAIVWWMYTHPPVRDRLHFCLSWQDANSTQANPRKP
ncbi:MAG: M48 family metalloprotease [Bryobacteraceae bacterium]